MCLGVAVLVVASLLVTQAAAFPGFFVGKGSEPRVNSSTHVVVLKKAGFTGVTIMPDYSGPLTPFAVVLPLPADVTLDAVKTLKRDFVDHIDQVTAPRFHEFWEMDPCEEGKAEQEWERDLSVKSGDMGFLGGSGPVGNKKLAKEMLVTVEPEFKQQSEYTFSMVPAAELKAALAKQGYAIPKGVGEQLGELGELQMLIAEVDVKRVELTGDARAILSPIRYVTQNEIPILSRLGLANSDGMQELFIYTIDPERRYEVKNYKNVYPPTNLLVDFKVKERMGEFYAGLHDRLRAKDPGAFVVEYAWDADGCGEPCPSVPIKLHEILGFGADAYEATLSEEELNPEPPERTEEEEKAYEAAEPEEKKKLDHIRTEVARRKALMSRHEGYVITRLHHRYDDKSLPKNVELAPAPHVTGGIDLPKGPGGTMSTDVESGGKTSQLQARYAFLHPNKKVIKCEAPKPHRWGKAPRTYRGLRKVWVAQDMASKNRKKFELNEIVHTAYAALELPGQDLGKAAGTTPEATQDVTKSEKSKCGCRLPGAGRELPGGLAALALALGLVVFRRR